MQEKDVFGGRHNREEEYFHKQEQEVIEKMRRKAQTQALRERLAERVGVKDEELLADLEALGYTVETVMLLHLVPLLQMAWAEGSISQREHSLIMEAAKARGIEQGSPAGQLLESWLTDRPSDETFAKNLRVIHTILHFLPEEERSTLQRDMLSKATAIAAASGGILGFGKVTESEKKILEQITQALDEKSSKP
jgi:hypothetical protein